jgi:membrane protease subunit HflC
MKALWLAGTAVAVLALALLAWSSLDTLGTSEIAVAGSGTRLRVLADRPGLFAHSPLVDVRRIEQCLQWLRVNGENIGGKSGATRMADVALSWRVTDVQRFLAASGGDMDAGAERLRTLLKQQLPALDLLNDMKDGAAALKELKAQATLLGVVAGNPQLLRVELTDSDTASAVQRAAVTVKARTDAINEQSARESAQLRLAGENERDALIAANARDAGKVRGDADAAAARIYARAYSKDPQFADFFRSLEAYRKVLGRDGDLLVITPDGDFFRYLQKPPSK